MSFCRSVVDFFKEMPQFFLKAGHILNNLYGSDWEKRLEVVSYLKKSVIPGLLLCLYVPLMAVFFFLFFFTLH